MMVGKGIANRFGGDAIFYYFLNGIFLSIGVVGCGYGLMVAVVIGQTI